MPRSIYADAKIAEALSRITVIKVKKMKDVEIIDLIPENIADFGVCGYKNVKKHLELRKKIDWFKEYYPKGLRIKVLLSKKGGYQGMLEYIPGKYAHRPVEAEGFMFIHCIFVGFKKEFKGKGYASLLIDECIKETKHEGLKGVAVVTRRGAFMAKKDIFVKKGFVLVDKAAPDFELLVLKFSEEAPTPKFRNMKEQLKQYKKGRKGGRLLPGASRGSSEKVGKMKGGE